MTRTACASFLLLMMGTTSLQAAEIVTQTHRGGVIIAQSHTYANAQGDLRIDEYGPAGSSVSASAAARAGAQGGAAFEAGEVRETTIYQRQGKAIVSLEGSICRKLTVQAEEPRGRFPGRRPRGGKFAEALGQAGAAIEQAMEQARRDGNMTEEQARAMREFMGGADAMRGEALSYEVRAMDESMDINGYRGEGYEVVDSRGRVAQRLWMTPTKRLKGANHVRDAMQSMMDTYREFLDQMGAGAGVMDTSMVAVFENDELRGKYPVRIEDLEADETTDVVAVASGTTDYYPDCEERSMFGM